MTAQRCVAEGLFEWPSDEPRVRASRCDACGFVTFPAQDACPSCGTDAVSPTLLSRTGTLWTWTRQRFGVGFVELPEGRIEARLAGDVDQELRIGMPMELTLVPFTTDEDGTEVLTYAFRPVKDD